MSKITVWPPHLKGVTLICTEELSLSTERLLTEGKAYKVLEHFPEAGRVAVIDDRGKECHANVSRFAAKSDIMPQPVTGGDT